MYRKRVSSIKGDQKRFRITANRTKVLPGRVVRNKRGGQVF